MFITYIAKHADYIKAKYIIFRSSVFAILIIFFLYLSSNYSLIFSKSTERIFDRNSLIFQKIIFSPDGQYIASSNYENHFLWDANSGEIIQKFPCNCTSGISFFSPDSRYLGNISKESYNIFDIVKKSIIPIEKELNRYDLPLEAFSYDNRFIIREKNEKQIFQINKYDFITGNSKIQELSLNDKIIKYLNSWDEVELMVLQKPVNDNWLVILYPSSEEYENRNLIIELFDQNTGKPVRKIQAPWNKRFIQNKQVLTGGNKIAMINPDSADLFDLEKLNHKIIKFQVSLGDLSTGYPYCISYDGKWLALKQKMMDGSVNTVVRIYDLETDEIISDVSIPDDHEIFCISVHPTRKLLATGVYVPDKKYTYVGKFFLYDIDTKKMLRELKTR